MKICPRCKEPHEKRGRYCSPSCANSRVFSQESLDKKSNSLKQYYAALTGAAKLLWVERKRCSSQALRRACRLRLLAAEWETLKWTAKRSRVRIEQNGKCLSCGLDTWLAQPLILEIDHIDGNGQNDARENLRGLCPNCHSLTTGWRGRGGTGHKKFNCAGVV